MVALLISGFVFAVAFIACMVAQAGAGVAVFAGIAGLIASQVLMGLFTRKKITAVQRELQELLVNGQKQMSRKIQMFQAKPGGNIKQLQRQIEADQKALVAEALAFTARFEPFTKWNLLMGRQIDTMRFQFLYQQKEFDAADKLLASQGLLKGPMLMDPMTVAMKMARQYKNQDTAGAEKTFKRHIKWFRGNRGTLLYGLMSWIYMEQGEPEKARLLLVKAKETTADETLARNWEMLANNKDKQFSNAGLSEEWYGLYLENPPMPKQQRIRVNARGGRPF